MEQLEQLRSIINNRKKYKYSDAVKLSEAAAQFIDKKVGRQHDKFEAISGAWEELLPIELRRHCEIEEISGGTLKVAVDGPSYLYELRLCSEELLMELQKECLRARLKEIKFYLGTKNKK